jgi:cyanophycin synthetase
MRESFVMVDYGHNADAFAAIGAAVRPIVPRRLMGVIAVPGDRANAVIEAAARTAAAAFDALVIKEDLDRRGRAQGEVARLLCDAVRDAAPERDCRVVPDEASAIAAALDTLGPGDGAVVFYDDRDVVMDVLRRFGAQPSETIAAELAAAA